MARTRSTSRPEASGRRRRALQVQLIPDAEGFSVQVAGREVRRCEAEDDAHHWTMHAMEAINRGMRSPAAIEGFLLHIYLQRQQSRTHRATSAALPQRSRQV